MELNNLILKKGLINQFLNFFNIYFFLIVFYFFKFYFYLYPIFITFNLFFNKF